MDQELICNSNVIFETITENPRNEAETQFSFLTKFCEICINIYTQLIQEPEDVTSFFLFLFLN